MNPGDIIVRPHHPYDEIRIVRATKSRVYAVRVSDRRALEFRRPCQYTLLRTREEDLLLQVETKS